MPTTKNDRLRHIFRREPGRAVVFHKRAMSTREKRSYAK
jgi:hypothetical protein